MATTGNIRVQLLKSGIGYDKSQKDTLRGLGLRKRHKIVEVKDTPAARGMIYTVRHLVRVLAGADDPAFKVTLEQVGKKFGTPGDGKKSPWKGVIVVPGPKTEPKPKKAAKEAKGKKASKKPAKKGK